MIQLAYDPAYDPFHAIFRSLQLVSLKPDLRFQRDHLRILDFYLLFPHFLSARHFRLSSTARSNINKIIKEIPEPYGSMPSPKIIFDRMRPFQLAAIDTLTTAGYFIPKELYAGHVQSSGKAIPENLHSSISAKNRSCRMLLEFVLGDLGSLPFLGKNGIKARSELMEWHHDIV